MLTSPRRAPRQDEALCAFHGTSQVERSRDPKGKTTQHFPGVGCAHTCCSFCSCKHTVQQAGISTGRGAVEGQQRWAQGGKVSAGAVQIWGARERNAGCLLPCCEKTKNEMGVISPERKVGSAPAWTSTFC